MEYRRSKTLIYAPDQNGVVSFNFLNKTTFECDVSLISFLNSLDDWTNIEELSAKLPDYSSDELLEALDQLAGVGALVARGSRQHDNEKVFEAEWRWGVPAAMLHFAVQDNVHLSLEQSEAKQLSHLQLSASPVLHEDNSAFEDVLALPQGMNDSPALQLMARRRTCREVTGEPLAQSHLADCLFSGMGIISSTTNCTGELPLSMTPSGGARNPFEAYVYVKEVQGIKPGMYHYSAMDHSLGLVKDASTLPSADKLVGDQSWMADMPCVIFLVAHLKRSMWKYDDANAYRVVLIEAGHIGQNIMLAATENGLTACPSAALAHSAIANACNLDDITISPVYALGIGKPRIH